MMKKSKTHIMKRIAFALLIPMGLFLMGLLLLKVMGTQASQGIDALLNQWWLPMTIIRSCVYFMLALFVIPLWLGKQQAQLQQQLEELQQQVAIDTESDTQAMQEYCDVLAVRIQRYDYLLSHKVWLLMMFCVFDVLTIQLPFWIK